MPNIFSYVAAILNFRYKWKSQNTLRIIELTIRPRENRMVQWLKGVSDSFAIGTEKY
jgi:hypothetical protein